MKKQFIESILRVISKGFNTDTNCSIVLGLVGAVIGFNNIPSFFKNKILNSSPLPSKERVRTYPSRTVADVVDQLLMNQATDRANYSF